MSNSFDCENYGDDCGSHHSGSDYTQDPEWVRRNWESTERFFTGMGLGAFCGFVAPTISLAILEQYSSTIADFFKYSADRLDVAVLGGFLGAGVGSLIGCYIGHKLYELEERWEEKKQKERLNQCTVDRKIDDHAIKRAKPEIPIEHFLTGDQKLNDIIRADDETVRKLGVTHEQIADRVEYFAKEARSRSRRYLYGGSVDEIFDDVYEIKTHSFPHTQKCPLHTSPLCEQKYGDMNVRVRNLKLGEELFFPSLITHSIREHRYYGGQKLHKVDPKRAVRILDIKHRCTVQKGNDKPTLENKRMFQSCQSSSQPILIGRSFEAKPVLYSLKWPRLEKARKRRRHELIKQILTDPETRRWHRTVDEVIWMYGIDL